MEDLKIKFVDGQMYEYYDMHLVDKDHPILTKPTEPFDFANPPMKPRVLAVSMIQTMAKHRGVGLAAPQVGIPYRVFVMGGADTAFACFNPKIIVEENAELDDFDEGCLSFPGLFLNIKRPKHIKYAYQDMDGGWREGEFDGFTARIFQHELDHLNGVIFTKLVSQYHLDKAKTKIHANLKQLKAEADAAAKRQAIAEASDKISKENQPLIITP